MKFSYNDRKKLRIAIIEVLTSQGEFSQFMDEEMEFNVNAEVNTTQPLNLIVGDTIRKISAQGKDEIFLQKLEGHSSQNTTYREILDEIRNAFSSFNSTGQSEGQVDPYKMMIFRRQPYLENEEFMQAIRDFEEQRECFISVGGESQTGKTYSCCFLSTLDSFKDAFTFLPTIDLEHYNATALEALKFATHAIPGSDSAFDGYDDTNTPAQRGKYLAQVFTGLLKNNGETQYWLHIDHVSEDMDSETKQLITELAFYASIPNPRNFQLILMGDTSWLAPHIREGARQITMTPINRQRIMNFIEQFQERYKLDMLLPAEEIRDFVDIFWSGFEEGDCLDEFPGEFASTLKEIFPNAEQVVRI